jgi:hypothetical protein
MKRFVLVIALLTAFSILPGANIQANLAPPPARLWFTFQDPVGKPLSPTALQLIACREDCTQGDLLLSYGKKCTQPGCLAGEPVLENSLLACSQALCLARSYDFPAGAYRLVAQINGKSYTSGPVELFRGEAPGYNTLAYRVTVSDRGLSLEFEPDFVQPDFNPYRANFFQALLLTLAIELSIAFLYLWFVLRWRGAALGLPLFLVFLADLVTLPLVWYFFPTLKPFTPFAGRFLGLFWLACAGIFTLVAYAVFVLLKGRQRWFILAGIVVLLLVAIPFCSLVIGYTIGYPNAYKIYPTGLPGIWSLVIAEIFAWLYEAFFVYFISRKTVPLKHALLLSLLMNLASYLAGTFLFSA